MGIALLKILDHVEWHDDAALSQIRVGLLGDNPELLKTLQEFSSLAKVRNKPVKVVHFPTFEQSTGVQVLMVSKEFNQDIERISTSLLGSATMIVTQECLNKKWTMINFIKASSHLTFEINRPYLVKEGFLISGKLLVLGGSELELSTVIDETQKSLKSAQARVSEFEQALDKGQKELERQAKRILQSEALLKEKQQEVEGAQTHIQELNAVIRAQDGNIAKQKKDLLEIERLLNGANQNLVISQADLVKKRAELNEKQQVLAEKLSQIAELESSIQKNLKILEDQNQQIALKETALTQQGSTIQTQRKMMLLFLVFLILTSGMGLLAFFNFRLKKKTAWLLEEKNKTLVIQQEEIRSQGVQLARQNDELELLDKVVQAMNRKTWLEELETSLLENAMSLFPKAEKASFLILDPIAREFFFEAMIGYDKKTTDGLRIPYDEAMERYSKGSLVLEKGVYLIQKIEGLSGEDRFRGHPRPLVMLAMSIEQDEQVQGFLILDNFTESDAFGEADISRLKRFRTHAVSALGKARLLEQLNHAHLELEKANKALLLANQQLEKSSLTDFLTGLRNRRYLQQVLPKDLAAVSRGYRPFSQGNQASPPENGAIGFVLLDLDHFKQVNDSYGHEAGDRVLKQLAEILQSVSRDADIVVRWGGEEFLIVALNFNPDDLHLMAERIRVAVASHVFELGSGQVLKKTCSLGAVVYPFVARSPDCMDWEQTLALADQALYIAKHSGRNAWVRVKSTDQLGLDDFVTRAKHGFAQMVRAGELELASSIADRDALQMDVS